MSKIGIYPGSFDPITLGHLDIIQRSLHVVDKLTIAVSNNKSKNHFISIDERLNLIEQTIQDLSIEDQKRIEIEKFDNLLVHYVKSKNASVIIRGLRAVSDFEYEFQLAGMNRKLDNNIETVFLMSDIENQIISSKFVKEIVKLNGDIKKFTTKSTIKLLKRKYE